MKNLITYLKALWRRGLDSQRKEVGVISGEATIEHPFSTYSAPFGTCWQPSGKLHSVVRCAAMLVMLFTIGVGNVWGAKDDVVYKINTASTKIATSTTYAKYGPSTCASAQAGSTVSTANWCVTLGSAQTAGLWLGSNSSNKAKMTLGNGSLTEASGIATAIGVTTSSTYYAAMICRTNLSKVYKVTLTYTTPGGTAPSEAWILYSTDNGSTWSVGKKVTSLSPSGTDFVFDNTITSAARYAFVIHCTNYCQFKVPVLTFYEGTTGGTTYTVTYNLNGGTGTTPTESAKSSGATFTLHNGTTNITPPSGKVFSQWKDQDNNYYNGGATYTMPAKNVTLTAQWVNTYTVTYNLNGGTGTTPTEGAHPSGATFTLHDGTTGITAPTKKEFSKWRDQDGSDYNGGVTYTMPAKAVTLTAQWVAAGGDYVLVEDAEDIGPGKYLIVYNNAKALNTHYGNVNANTYATYTDISSYYSNKKIAANATTNALAYTVAETANGYSISHIESGTTYYLGNSSNSTGASLRWDNPFTASTDEWTLGVNSIVSARNSNYAIRWNNNSSSYRFAIYNPTGQQAVQLFKQEEVCDDPELAYGTGSVTKTYGASAFTNPLTNSHSVAVTYSSSDPTVATVNGSGQVTILKAGSTTITASAAKQTVSEVNYCADEVSYTLTVNKANISPTLTYSPNSVTVGSNTSAPTVGANPGGGGVTYAITSATPPGCATINTSTGVVTGVAVGSVTVTATVAATDNYNGNTATATVSIIAASYFQNGATVFIQADSKDYSAWKDDACVKAWFNASGAGGAAQTTYWLFDATDTDAGKKLFAAVVPASGNLNQVTVQRFAEGCGSFWNDNGTLTQASSGGVNTLHSYGSADNNIAWNGSSTTLSLYGSQNSWASSLATFTDQGSGVWTASFNNYAPDATSKDYKIKTSYNNGWIGNTGSNNNATLSGMIVGSTYNVTATLNVTTHALTMSKTFVKGEVSFDLQGHGSAISKLTNVAAGSKISAPSPAPSATGWDFGGWFKEPACTNAWDFANDVVNETMTLYAKWTKHTYTITSTLNNCSSSPAIPSSYEYTGSAASLSYTITPSSGYRLPTTITVSGTTYTWNSTTGALVLTGTIASNVTITISAVQTHTVDWYVGGSAVGNKLGDDGQTTVVDHGGKISDFPAHDPDGSACDKTFVGWTNTSSYVHGTSPLFNDVAGSPTINADASFYAVFAEVNSVSASLTKMTADDDLEVGDKIVIIAQDTRYGMYQASASSYVSYWTTADGDGEPSLSEIEADDKKYLDVAAGSASNTWKLGDATNGYLYNASSTNLEFSTTNSSDLTLITWTDDSFTFVAGQEVSCRTDITGANANKWRGAGASCDPETGDNCSGTPYYYLYKYVPSSTTATGHTIICASCSNEVTVSYDAAPTGATVAVMKGGTPVTENGTVKTCTGSIELTVTITPAAHYTLNSLSAQISSTDMSQSHVGNVYTVTIPQNQTGTLVLTPSLTEDAHKVISWVVHGSSASIADGHGTTWVYSGENLTAIPTAPDAPTGCDDKVFVGWSENDGGATEEDASYYDDRFTTLGEAPTGITTDKTFTAVFATPAAGLGGTVMWEEDFSGFSANDAPNTSYGSAHTGTTVYNSGSVTYACTNGGSDTKVYTSQISAGGTSPELLVGKNTGVFAVTNIPTGGQTELTLTYKSNKSANDFTVTSGTSGVTIGDASNSGTTYTRTITISQSPSATNSFALSFSMTANSNARLDDISLVVPGSSSSSAYVTTCEETYTITYNKNTTDPVTNLPSPTGISQATGSGTLSSKVPVRYAYTFMGWSNTSGENNTVDYAAGAAISSVSADKTLYAVWQLTAVTEINLSKSSLDKYVGDPSVTLSVLSVLPDGASTSVNWSSSNTSVATVSASGEVNFLAVGTATITATSTVTNTTTATCVVTVWAKPTATFLDNMHGLTVDENSVALSSYNLEAAAGTAVVFPTLANQIAGSGTCEDEHYIFVGWTTSDNNDDPEDHLVSSYTLTNGDAITYYAVWADGVSGTTYVKLTDNSFSTSKHYVIGAVHPDNGTTYYFNSCAKTDKDNSWGYVTADLASDTPIEFTLSGTASALVATTTESTSRYLKPTSTNEFHMSSISQTIMLKSDGKIYSTDETRRLLLNKSQPGLRWYGTGAVSGTSNAYFYEVVAGGEVNYRTSCCADKVPAPTVTATQTSVSVTLNWNDLSGSGATGYEVSWNDGAWTSPSGTRTHSVSGLTPNTTYTWKVRATYTTPKCGADIASGSTTTNQVYHVTYAGGSGTGTCNATGSTTDATAYEAGATVTLQANGFTLVGHTFNEWTEDDEDITISSNQFTMPEHDVVITATWTPKVDKFYDRMHDGTDASHGGIADGDGKYYITREGCSYTVPSLTDNTSGATACHTKHYVLMGWTAESHLNSDGTLKTGHEGNVYTGGGTQTATGATYYAVWAEVEE